MPPNDNSLPQLAHQALLQSAPEPSSAPILDALPTLARHHHRRHIFLRTLQTSAALLALTLSLLALHHSPSSPNPSNLLSATDAAIDLLLLEEYGIPSDPSISPADRLLLFQEAPGFTF